MNRILPKQRVATPNEMDPKSRLLYAVNGVAEMLLTADDVGFENSLREAMALVARCLTIDRVYIWQNITNNGNLQYVQQFGWLSDSCKKEKTVQNREGFSYTESIPEWEGKFLRGECINGPLSTLSQGERERLSPYGITSILVTPVYLQNVFWGFVSFDDCHKERVFTQDEIDILHSANLMMVTAMDRHQTVAKIREADEHAKLMLDATPLCCSLWDEEYNLMSCNEEAVNFYGLKNKQEYLDRFFELSPGYQPDGSVSIEKALEYIDIAFREGRTVFEWTHQMPDGTPVPTEVTIVRVPRGDAFIVVGYTRDLREQKKMIKAIEYKDSLLNTVNEVATILLRSGTDEFDNNLWRCMGMVAESVHADRMYIWKNYEKDAQLYTDQIYEWSGGTEPLQGGEYTKDVPYSKAPIWRQKLSDGQCINGPVYLMTEEEQAYLFPQGILSILVVPVFLRDQFWGFVGFDDCHTERVFSEDEESILRSASLLITNALLRNEMTHDIQAAVGQAEAASKAKSAFLARMSHEIRTPMNVIAGMTELVLREDIPVPIYENVLNIQHASSNMLSLISDILDFSKIEAGSLDIVPVEYSLTSLINDVLNIIRMKVREKPVLFTVNIDCNIPNRLIGDETRVRQILLNVLDNAAKYTAEGFISLTLSGETQGDTVLLTSEVSDSGIGIKKEDMDKLFNDFARFDGERHKSVQGTGLGLAITSSLCQAMGGSISVASEHGAGSTFTITIPQKIKSHDEKYAGVSSADKKAVLLYETRPLCAGSIVRSLENLGVHCTLVKSPKELCDELKSRAYPFIFIPSVLFEGVGSMMDDLNLDTTLVLILELGETPVMHNIRTISAPVHSASIANILDDNESNIYYNTCCNGNVRFIAPSADILVVDDLSTNLKVAQGLMLPYQMQIDICESGEAAIAYVQNKRYDIIFMDHMMPEMDGIEATHRIRSLENGSGYYKDVPIIALTANAVSGVKEMFLQNGMNDFLAKPIDVAKLRTLLEKWIPKEKKEKLSGTRERRISADITPLQIEIDGVDIPSGIAMTGGRIDGYLKTISSFYADGSDRAKKIRDCMEKNDIKTYTTYTHALKSAAANIGAWKVSDLFKALEMAGIREDVGFIRENHERGLGELEILLKNIHAVFAKNQDKPITDKPPELIRGELVKLKNAIQNRDAGEVDDIMNILETATWNEQEVEVFKEVSKNLLLINYTDAAIWVDNLLDRVGKA